MQNLKIWFAVSELQGLIKSEGLADVAKALSRALKALEHTFTTTIPGCSMIPGFF